jgi:hypothetical protein
MRIMVEASLGKKRQTLPKKYLKQKLTDGVA